MYRVGFRCLVSAIGVILSLEATDRALGGIPPAAAATLNSGLLQSAGLPPDFAGRIENSLAFKKEAAEWDQQKAWLAQLKSFYSSRGGAPVWVDQSGFNKKAQSAMAELAKADEWGLDPAEYAPPLLTGALTLESLAEAEIALSNTVVKYAFHAHGGRIDPTALSLWLDRDTGEVYATAVMIDIISGADPGQVLRDMHPKAEAFQQLRRAYMQMRVDMENPKPRDPSEIMELGEPVKLGKWHPHVLIVRNRLKIKAAPGYETLFDKDLANALHRHLWKKVERPKWGVIDDNVRDYMNEPPPPPTQEDLNRVLANMERWRWVPHDLGSTYVWNNLPEYMTRMYKDGALIHEERIIIGQPDTQTPVFSAKMREVVFQPEWGVPPSIKINDLLPKFQDGDFDVLNRRDMRILSPKGKELNPERFDWDKTDIRDVGIYQRAGDSNPLGLVKFLFPNKHHVYMHDTNNRPLFKNNDRAFSHGCVRLRNPERFAEIILGDDQGWSPERVKKELYDWDKPNNKFELSRPFYVHNVYFTLISGPDNTLVELPDVYGHDKRVIQALEGVPWENIAANDPARSQKRELDEAAPPAVKKALREAGKNQDDEE